MSALGTTGWALGAVGAAVVALLAGRLRVTVRRYAVATGLTDVPNTRSSHLVPTPRGGGLAIVAAFLGATIALAATGVVAWRDAAALAIGGAAVALAGYLDDRRGVSARVRFAVHAAAAVSALALLGGPPSLASAGLAWVRGPGGWIAATVAAVWLVNLYNFMDGIDGIAAGEAASVGAGAAAVAGLLGASAGAVLWPMLLAAAALGYLWGNRGRGRIFLGDVGSGFLGWCMAALLLWSARVTPALFWPYVILLGVFMVDATLTLLRRLMRGERVTQPHRSHAYQRAARRVGRHAPVSAGAALLTLAWLFPLAVTAARRPALGAAVFAVAAAPLVLLWLVFGGGTPDEPTPVAPPAFP